MSADEAVLHQNETTVVIAQLDPAVGESTLEGICDVDGIDVIFVSLGSLAVDAIDGKEGRPGLALRSRIGSIVSMAHAKGKVVGAHVENASAANDAVSEGVRLISVSYDRAIYMGGVRDLVERLN
jgi:2-keto-3-deoxy-L-rhamnonate aldolase RhmA